MPPRELLRVWRGYYPGRSGEIQLVTKEPHVIGNWYSHSGPWDYLQRVPLFWYGPGHVAAVGRVDRPVTVADIAPTMARMLDFEFEAPDGRPMVEALEDAAEPPRLIMTLVWDGGGRNVLAEYPDAWPNLRRLIHRGTWFENASVGSSPSITPAIHANLGTGAFPRTHGVVDARLRLGTDLARPEQAWPEVMTVPALADLYDRRRSNEPLVGVVAAHTWHLTMIGSGRSFAGGDRDLAFLRASKKWGLHKRSRELYRTHDYPNQVPGLDDAIRRMDLEDGQLDGVWLGASFRERPQMLPRTPAHTEWQTLILEEVIRREGFGADDVPDLLFTNYKQIDYVGHAESMNSPQMEAVLRATDQALGELVRMLDRRVGEGQWAMVLTADHGATPHPSSSGALFLLPKHIQSDIREAFDDDDGRDVVQAIRPTEMWIDVDELQENGFTLNQLARFLTLYTREQYAPDAGSLSAEQREERLFSAAIPGPLLERLPCLRSEGS